MQLKNNLPKIFFGLGNPDLFLLKTRHNVGCMLIDFIKDQLNLPLIKKEKFYLLYKNDNYFFAKSLVFMNNSGIAVKEALKFTKLSAENLYVVHDDLDLEFGKFKIQFKKGPKVHNGVISVTNYLKTDCFYKIRIGIESRINKKQNGRDFVLSRFSAEEESLLKTEVFFLIMANIGLEPITSSM